MCDRIGEEFYFRSPEFSKKLHRDESKDSRSPHQRDLGRITHSYAFRKLQAKTQVLGTREGDFHRTRLTHSLEVGQIARSILSFINRNSDQYKNILPTPELMEAICYAHDIGHPPFGHQGEVALHQKMLDFGGFEGNAQTLRILLKTEQYHLSKGLLPTRRFLLGVLKYPAAYSNFLEINREAFKNKPPKCYYDEEQDILNNALGVFSAEEVKEFTRIDNNKLKTIYKTLDCSIMELADDIGYGVHDLEDAINMKIIQRDDIERLILDSIEESDKNLYRISHKEELLDLLFSKKPGKSKQAISKLTTAFVSSIEIEENETKAFNHPLLKFKAQMLSGPLNLLTILKKDIVGDKVIHRREMKILEYKGHKIIYDLFDVISKNLEMIDKEIYGMSDIIDQSNEIKMRITCDFISGMTDRYAESFHRRLFEPGFGGSRDII